MPDLDDEIVTVHATYNEQIPPRSQGYYDNLSTEISDKPEDVGDYMYLVGL